MPCPYKQDKNIKTIMKKTYIKPAVDSFEVNCKTMMALSTVGTEVTDGNQDDFEQLGREEKKISSPGVWGNEW